MREIRVLPTRRCFDDAAEMLCEMLTADPSAIREVKIVHALIETNEPGREGQIIAHGWLEFEDGVFFRGIIDGETIDLRAPRRQFYKECKPKLIVRYTPREVAELNERTGHTGPWDDVFMPYVGIKITLDKV